MYQDKEEQEFVNEKTSRPWNVTTVILKLCGNCWQLTEAHENYIYYGGTRKKVKLKDGKVETVDLGRKSEASLEQQQVNARRVQARRNHALRDLMNCNEDDLTVFDTLTGTGDYRDIDQANADRFQYQKRLERFCQTGKLYRTPVKGFRPVPEYRLKLLGVIEFQDGHRRKDGKGTGNVHFHHFQNTPYLPQVNVIHANFRDAKTLLLCEHYLNYQEGLGFYWSKVADRSTLWFNTEKELVVFLRARKAEFPGDYYNAELKKLCVNALLWERGHTKPKKLQDLRKHGKLSNPGEYLCQYLSEDADPRLREHRGWYKAGTLARPKTYRDPIEIDRIIREVDLWSVFTHKVEFMATYLGAMTYYFFNWWMSVYPWIKVMYEKKARHEKMERVDWLASGVIEEFQPLLL